MLCYSKCTRFTVCLSYSDISLSLYINKRWITLPVYYSRLFASKAVFEQFCRSLNSLFTVPNNRRTREESLFWKGSSAGAIFFPENRNAPLSNFAAKRSKDSRFSSYLPIENLSKRPGASLRRKLKSHSVWTVKMRRKIHTCQLLFNHVVND